MISLVTNMAAGAALQTLAQTNRDLETPPKSVSTGLSAGTAQDNADYWSIATTLGSAKSHIDTQKDFIAALTVAIERGVGQLVDADMSEESTRLQALQVQAQLGIQALSIANQSSQNILALFQ